MEKQMLRKFWGVVSIDREINKKYMATERVSLSRNKKIGKVQCL